MFRFVHSIAITQSVKSAIYKYNTNNFPASSPWQIVNRFHLQNPCCNTEKTEPLVSSIFRNITKDRSTPIPVETSVKYLKSEAYQQTYGNGPVWGQYRRNHKGALPPRKTRKTCIRQGVISTGNPCPICRDEYLVLSEHNPDLLRQFISAHTGATLSYEVTGLCQKRHQELLIAVQRAKDRGIITFDVPFRRYDYTDYLE